MGAIATGACPNCDAALSGPYCASCGQKAADANPTLRDLVHETAQELTQLDGKVPSTLRALFLEPGRLTVDFLAGRRARWLPPLRLYLICSVAFFLSGPLVEALTHRSARAMARLTVTGADGITRLTPEGRREIEQGLPARIFGVERLERAVADPARLDRTVKTAYPKAMFVLLPLFALLTHLAWRRAMPRYPAHLYAALHLHAAWFGALAISTLLSAFFTSLPIVAAVGVLGLVYVLWYALVAVRRVFGEPWGLTIAKAAAVAVVYGACLMATSLVMLGAALMTL
jgi:hypothetical protein